ncbi:hypothetical protein INS49_004552 [Diaporthe citri]|uniref:uncharacterized protein n=1 Tax=Diaporthe citri TaxID=83186 RepID=UPI001C814CAC|nr:uncharacterized protein INS49_004552 [Diaporthe citri]KAG6354535.1 hypothetical protein INS49_004552 [Diaporthe citri]
MAEPATVLAIVEGLGNTAKFCFHIIRRAAHAPEEIKQLNAEACNWRPQLQTLSEFLEDDDESADRLRRKFENGGLLEVKSIVEDLNRVLQPFQTPSLRKRFTWTFAAGNQVNELLTQLRKGMEVIISSLQIEHAVKLRDVQNEIRQIQTSQTNEYERRNILQWLKPEGIDAHEFHRQKQALREEGTCDWLANSLEWNDWWRGGSANNARFLWIHGLPGAGKTVLASFAIDNVISKYQHKGVSYYYCSHERQKQGHTSSQEACSFLRWVIRDLTAQVSRPKTRTSKSQATIPKKLEDLYEKHDLNVQSLLECLLAVTQHIAKEFKQQVCIVVDAVDESPAPRDALLNILTTIGADPEWQHVSLCFTSRNEVDISTAIMAIQPPQDRRGQHPTPTTLKNRVFLTPKRPSDLLKERGGVNLSGFDGMPPPAPVGNPWERGRTPSGGASEFSLTSQRTSRSEIRAPSGDVPSYHSGPVRSISMSPAEESYGFDPMEIDSVGHCLPGVRKAGCTILSMDENPDVKEAIRIFVASQLHSNGTFETYAGLNNEGLQEVISLIAKRAKGMFRWAACQVDIIIRSNLCDLDSISEMLEKIPPDIFGTYEHMITKLLPDGRGQNEHNRNFARTALALICSPSSAVPCADVLVEASRFDVPHGNAHNFGLTHLQKILGCLITVSALPRRPETIYTRVRDHRLDPNDPEESVGVKTQVSVAHYTVKEYLFDKETALGEVKEFALSKELIENLELRVIFGGLRQFGSFRHPEARCPSRYEEYCLKMTDKALKERRDLIIQDKSVWKDVIECLKWNSKHNLPRSGAFPNLKTKANFPNWTKTSPFERENEPKMPETSVLVSLMLLQWPELAKMYLADLSESTKRDIWRDKFELTRNFKVEGTEPMSVMQLSVTRRDVDFLQALIDARADFSGEKELVMDLFYHAYGHKSLDDQDGGAKTGKMLKMLLERGVRPEVPGYVFTPLQFAVSNLEDRWVHDLLFEGANPNATGTTNGVYPFGDEVQIENNDRWTWTQAPLKICENTTPKWYHTESSSDKELMEDARERVKTALLQWGAEVPTEGAVVVDSD